MTLRTWLVCVALLGLTGCSSFDFTPCPTLVSYSPEFNDELINELVALPAEYDRVVEVVADYKTLRRQLKECQ